MESINKLTLRAAVEADLPLLAQMNRQLIEDESSRNPMRAGALEQRMAGWLHNGWQIRLFFCAGETQPLGYAVYQLRADEYFPEQTMVYLRQMFIRRERRSQGMGQAAFQRLAAECFPAASTVVIDVLEVNPRGRKYWEKLGFLPYATTMHFANQRTDEAQKGKNQAREG